MWEGGREGDCVSVASVCVRSPRLGSCLLEFDTMKAGVYNYTAWLICVTVCVCVHVYIYYVCINCRTGNNDY